LRVLGGAGRNRFRDSPPHRRTTLSAPADGVLRVRCSGCIVDLLVHPRSADEDSEL